MFTDFLEREDRRETERNIDWLPPARTDLGSNLQPRYLPWPGIEPATFLFIYLFLVYGRCSSQLSHWPGCVFPSCTLTFVPSLRGCSPVPQGKQAALNQQRWPAGCSCWEHHVKKDQRPHLGSGRKECCHQLASSALAILKLICAKGQRR